MDKKTKIAKFKALLAQRRADLVAEGDVEIIPESAGDDTVRKPDDDAMPLAEMNQVIASTRNRARAVQLRRIAEALGRLGEDPEGFGLCEGCEEPIPSKRLELMPWVTLCIKCQQREEDDNDQSRRRHLLDYD